MEHNLRDVREVKQYLKVNHLFLYHEGFQKDQNTVAECMYESASVETW
jgi:hypothetical protein